jgi:hypothetical protein
MLSLFAAQYLITEFKTGQSKTDDRSFRSAGIFWAAVKPGHLQAADESIQRRLGGVPV